MDAGVHLRRTAERLDEVEAVAAALSAAGGGRVGLGGVLSDLNRSATVVRVPAPAAHWGFRWADQDAQSRRWWPQGITTSADHDESEAYDGHRVVMVSWYSKDLGGVHKGAEKSFDISADLDELARTPVIVVSAGPKVILDIEKTLEVLETPPQQVQVTVHGGEAVVVKVAR